MILQAAPRTAVILLLILGSAEGVEAQESARSLLGCDVYEHCALRVQHRLLGSHVVRGAESTSVARIGLGTPPLEDLFARSDSALVSFHRFRTNHIRSSWLTVLGGLEFIGGVIAEANGNDDWAVGLSIGGIVLEVAGGIFRTKASEHLSRAIWWHNGSLGEAGSRAGVRRSP